MTDQATPHSNDHGVSAADDARTMHPVARLVFGWTVKPWAGAAFFWGLLGLSVFLIGIQVISVLLSDSEHHGYLWVEDITAIHAIWGFASFTLVVLVGWPLGRLLRRPEDYYGDEEEPAGEEGQP